MATTEEIHEMAVGVKAQLDEVLAEMPAEPIPEKPKKYKKRWKKDRKYGGQAQLG